MVNYTLTLDCCRQPTRCLRVRKRAKTKDTLPELHYSWAGTMAAAPVNKRTIYWEDGKVRTIDQRKLPASFEMVSLYTLAEVGSAIKTMLIRGAPAIGQCLPLRLVCV